MSELIAFAIGLLAGALIYRKNGKKIEADLKQERFELVADYEAKMNRAKLEIEALRKQIIGG